MDRPEPEYFRPEDVAAILKVSTNTVYRLVDRGEMLAIRVGRSIRIDPADVRRFEREHIIEPGSIDWVHI